MNLDSKIDETRYYLLEETKHNDLRSGKHNETCRTSNYSDRFLIFCSAVSVFVSISAFALLLGVPVGITSSAVELKTSALTAVIKKYKSIIKKKRKTMIK